jgi:hypothetical protein
MGLTAYVACMKEMRNLLGSLARTPEGKVLETYG